VRDFVAYHSAKKMGYELHDSGPDFQVLTRRRFNSLVGCRVFLLEGRARSKRQGTLFLLHGYFSVHDVEDTNEQGFKFLVSGTGRRITPRDFGSEPWFGCFMKHQRNFESGLNPVSDDDAERLTSLFG
jgi:hypothetical protein